VANFLTKLEVGNIQTLKYNSIADICATLKISKRTLYRYTGEPVPETGNPPEATLLVPPPVG
jgi:hypothetical protein